MPAKWPCGAICITAVMALLACSQRQEQSVPPWQGEADTSGVFDLPQIEQAGELIALTLSGPETYYDYQGSHLGLHYLLAERFAGHLGVRLRVDVCRDTAELVGRLADGDADLIALPMTADTLSPGWMVGQGKGELQNALLAWYNPQLMEDVRRQEQQMLTKPRVKRRVHAPMLRKGVISYYDELFKRYARGIGWDWRLLAAQCYQESTFDPKAVSFAGAKGLMQIMPGTADHLGVSRSRLYEPETNIAAATKYIAELQRTFADIGNHHERTNFVLASYNGGAHHIRDAMALAQRDGKNSLRWSEVAPYVLKLAQPQYYNDPIVKYGYMRGSETVDYVAKIRQRYVGYQGVKTPHVGFHGSKPRKSDQRKKKYDL